MTDDNTSPSRSNKFQDGMQVIFIISFRSKYTFFRIFMEEIKRKIDSGILDSKKILLQSYQKKKHITAYYHLKPGIVIDIGGRWTRYGISGEFSPRGLLASIVLNPEDGKKVHWLSNRLPEEQKRSLILFMMKKIINK